MVHQNSNYVLIKDLQQRALFRSSRHQPNRQWATKGLEGSWRNENPQQQGNENSLGQNANRTPKGPWDWQGKIDVLDIGDSNMNKSWSGLEHGLRYVVSFLQSSLFSTGELSQEDAMVLARRDPAIQMGVQIEVAIKCGLRHGGFFSSADSFFFFV